MGVDRARVERLYLSGVEALHATGAGLADREWSRTICGDWTAADVARHVLAVAGWYHEWLDRAARGESDPPFPADELDARNEAERIRLADVSGTDALKVFSVRAREHLDRVATEWDTPFGYPFGTVTAGLHLGVAAAEWHLHAWDLGQAAGVDHEPDDPHGLFLAAGACVAASEGGVKGAVLRTMVPLGAQRKPWSSLLRRSGR